MKQAAPKSERSLDTTFLLSVVDENDDDDDEDDEDDDDDYDDGDDDDGKFLCAMVNNVSRI